MKVVCIKKYLSQGLQLELTYGKIYHVDKTRDMLGEDFYWVINDRGYKEYYLYSDFVSLEEWRSGKLNELGIN
jgi:hypothetical protein